MTSPSANHSRKKSVSRRTLAIDVGGTGIKAIVLDAGGKPLTERARVPTPPRATPKKVVETLSSSRRNCQRTSGLSAMSMAFSEASNSGRARLEGFTKSPDSLESPSTHFLEAPKVAKESTRNQPSADTEFDPHSEHQRAQQPSCCTYGATHQNAREEKASDAHDGADHGGSEDFFPRGPCSALAVIKNCRPQGQ
jgi:hypothetical protein